MICSIGYCIIKNGPSGSSRYGDTEYPGKIYDYGYPSIGDGNRTSYRNWDNICSGGSRRGSANDSGVPVS